MGIIRGSITTLKCISLFRVITMIFFIAITQFSYSPDNHDPVYGRKDLPEEDIGIGEKVIAVHRIVITHCQGGMYGLY